MRRPILTLLTMLAGLQLASAQAPDISVTGTFTASGQNSTPVFVGGTGAQTGIVGWRLTYFVDGTSFTAASAGIQGADAANAAGCTGASYATITAAGSSAVEVANPAASAAQGNVGLKSYYPCIRVNLAGVTGSGGTITWQLAGYRNLFNFPITATVTPSGTTDVNLIQIKGVAVDSNSGNKSAGTLRTVLATDQPSMTNPQPENVTQLAGTAIDTNSGAKSGGTQRVVLATDQPALTNPLPENLQQLNGTTVDTNSGAKSGGTLRVVLATDQPALTNPVPENLQQLNGTTVDTNSGAKSGGTLRVVLATDQPSLTNPQPTNETQMAGSAIFPCLSQLAFDLSASGNTEIIPLTAAQVIRICHMSFSTVAAEDVRFTQGTGTNCGTGTANLSGLYKSVQSEALDFGPFAPMTNTAGNAVCINQSAGQALGGIVMFDKR